MKVPSDVWVIWTKDSLDRLQAWEEASRFVFSSEKAAKAEATNYRKAGYKAVVSHYREEN